MKCLFNCTTNVVGGGAKNSAIFIKNVIKKSSISWHFAISPQVKRILDDWGVIVPQATLFPETPAKSLKARRSLTELSKRCKADVVYTMAGPSYVKFSMPHVQGISNPHITHPVLTDIRSVTSFLSFCSYLVHSTYQRRKAVCADYFIFQTQTSLEGFCDRMRVSRKRAVVISNAADVSAFENSSFSINYLSGSKINILCPAAPYLHKGLEFIPDYARCLVDLGFENFVFTLTISRNENIYKNIVSRAYSLGVLSKIDTIGPYSYNSAATVYASCDFVFVPSLLETFSATYLEAFASRRPLIAADRAFARDICGEAAVYIDPHSPDDVATQIVGLVNTPESSEQLVCQGIQVLESCETQVSRTNKICDYLLYVYGKKEYV